MKIKMKVIWITGLLLLMSCITLSEVKTDNYQKILNQAYIYYKGNTQGANADYIPELAKVDSKQFAIVLVTADGKVYGVGDSTTPFAIESISKVFSLGLALKAFGSTEVLDKIGSSPTGLPFNSVIAIEQQANRTGNALVNAGAISTVSLLGSKYKEDTFNKIMSGLSDFSGAKLSVNNAVYLSEKETYQHNLAIANLLDSYGKMYSSVNDSLDTYTQMCSMNVTTKNLAVMGATLANNGVNPITHKRIISAAHTHNILAMMAVEGMYDNSGKWLYQTGVPAKSGVGGGIIAVVPGKFAIATFSHKLDSFGNSVRGQLAIKYILKTLNLRVL